MIRQIIVQGSMDLQLGCCQPEAPEMQVDLLQARIGQLGTAPPRLKAGTVIMNPPLGPAMLVLTLLFFALPSRSGRLSVSALSHIACDPSAVICLQC